jgi:cytochrome c-type biogenesis protein
VLDLAHDSTIATGALPVAALVALAAGLVSFASPCVLPLVPGFLGYVTGLSEVALEDRPRSRLVLGALLFVVGFSVVVISGVLVASVLSEALREHQSLLVRIGGGMVIVLSLVFLGMGTQRSIKPRWKPAAGLVGAPLLGIVFGLGWSPCLGPTLAAILALTSSLSGGGQTVQRGILLGVAYCLGLGIPFLLVAAGWSAAGRASSWLRQHQRGVQLVGGGLLLVVGVLMVSGVWETATTWAQTHLIGTFQTAL